MMILKHLHSECRSLGLSGATWMRIQGPLPRIRGMTTGSGAAAPTFDADTARIYNRISENHRQSNGPWSLMSRAIVSRFADSPNARILDLASGPGEPAATIARSLTTASVTATDVSPEMVETAKSQSHLPNMTALLADMQDLPFQDRSFDAVTCCYGYMFPENKELALKETARVLAKGGTLVATVWLDLSLMHLPKAIMAAVYGDAPPPPPALNPLALSHPPDALETMLKQAGFVNLQSTVSTYDINCGDFAFEAATLPIGAKLTELDGWDIAREVFHEKKEVFGSFNEDGSYIFKGNTFKMVVANTPE